MQVSPIMRWTGSGHVHWCPACEDTHPLPKSWAFNGDVNKPTFNPSFRQTFVHFEGEPGSEQAKRTREDRVCHYIITDGLIQFCCDSWHGRSDIVAMPPLPGHLRDSFAHETQD